MMFLIKDMFDRFGELKIRTLHLFWTYHISAGTLHSGIFLTHLILIAESTVSGNYYRKLVKWHQPDTARFKNS